ncbi:phage holin family protein [Epilithonimonas mollis]|uniref:Bacteriophage holin family protein n=1 Tax=Epilithonimonas mollis TaxID=216903 RepID=A0A1M6UL08_9FLAO|nr:phage holin family protein [Epilithonimonas mollis]SHK69867.1 Bacteriophage holin family protein [Epilithonimonas mollis]
MELQNYKHHAFAFLTAVKKPAVAVPTVGMISLSDCQLGIFLLIILMLLDFITGVFASWVIWENSKVESKFWKYGFTSTRLRLSLVKCVTYFLFILCAFGIEYIFKIKSWKAENYTEHQITLTLITIAIACAIEFYSIFFENLPKAGFDIETKVKLIFSKFKKAVTSVKDLTNGDSST